MQKVFKYGFFSGPYFPVFGLNTEIYSVNFGILSKYGKIRTRKNSIFGYFLRSEGTNKTFIALSSSCFLLRGETDFLKNAASGGEN